MKSILIIFTALLFGISAQGQCFQLAKDNSKTAMAPYVHDGNYNALVLNEGQNAEIYKTFYSDQEYRILFSKEATLPNIQFTIMDENHVVLFSNNNDSSVNKWDFKLDKSQKLIISFKIPKADTDQGRAIKKGCISVLIGLLQDEKA